MREAWSRIADWHGLVNDEVARRRVPHAALADTALANAWTHRNEANLALAQVLVNGAHAGRDAHWREAHALATSAAEDAERALARFARAPIASTAAPLARVLEHLDPRDALVTFVADDASGDASGAGHLLAFVARSGHAPRLADLGALATLEPAIAAWRRAIATPPGTAGAVSRARAQALGAAVRARVWDTLAPVLIGATRVDIVEDGVVTALPWQALPFTDGRVLAEREPLVRVLSAERRRLEAEPVVQGSLLALGGADFGTAAPSSNAAAAAVSLRGHDDCGAWPVFTALPSTRTEAEAVAALWRETPGSAGAKVLTGAAATEQAFMGEASGHAVLHLATHGFVLRDTCGTSVPGLRGVGGVAALEPAPGRRARKATSAERAPRANDALGGRRVWLALAGANVPDVAERDGLLTAEEVATLDLASTDWVVLSACHSALAEQWTRQGAQGMARAFQLAGAHTVIASQWSVSDTATLEWMRALYAARMHGARGAAEAMRQATRTVLVARRARGEDSHPFYWAAFSANER